MPRPVDIVLKTAERRLDLRFDDGVTAHLPAHYLRVFSPSAEVRGHGGAKPLAVLGKASVAITRIEPVGHYAVRLVFDDGHDSGLYRWDYLYELSVNQASNWAAYLADVENTGR
ncbi:1-(5-phosphoribosyl)-5-((5-phosphoribosylamino) methylideneamino)imidazole-4-carboxamide isomerase [Iodidimonas muriae]|uniref:1-(5-phosphoribosyl)-5-((5-phosphoribosylamino) methylideneamino)imidazole-4-carboxamide isomerase n=1 Tax=Iodidimonas muriae TaxID=261467 RepID=A0ABQ2L9J8_9PROT|nr:gamma-butyrobetaine hydroxylase-like domain-containing protein [Iodidimonas muriae]GER05981.1 1-(5-phosphoribosyl)-5-((5-phosphoribosylamino) me thylideneamino)imidazole-4-carboxamide isomerase [Kordiimonadales bacterium JCM 17843]GGO07699.1 1-(5-phosphoribosyl)-5-((5-phosphoribosylamino) methylideneamino)imidazole-4-carboxamide isomerase [Iodidimonas muriae]